ncbi:MAG: DNA polymerase III subunit beta [Oscillospiraceae bacterium]|nr:DNA polymerase III subunit beta [Oscillospiraceae bacterium]
MIFSCEKAVLLPAISTASKAVSTKSTIPALEGILIEANESLLLTGYNLETGIQTICPALVEQPGTTVVNARLFGEILRRLPDDIVSFKMEGDLIHISCQASHFQINSISPDDFPELPAVEQLHMLSIPEGTLKSMISETLFATSRDESKPIHTGSLFEVEENQLTLVAVDGYRLAIRREQVEIQGGETSFSFVVPGPALSEVEKIASDGENPVIISQGSRHVTFQIGDTTLLSRRLEGEFLNYKQAILNKHPITIIADAKTLLQSVDRVSLIINEKLKSPLRCTFGENSLFLKTATAIGVASDTCSVEGNGGGLEIGFNNRFLLDVLKAVPAETVRLKLNTNVSPCLILPEAEEDDHFLYMVLPVRLKAGT